MYVCMSINRFHIVVYPYLCRFHTFCIDLQVCVYEYQSFFNIDLYKCSYCFHTCCIDLHVCLYDNINSFYIDRFIYILVLFPYFLNTLTCMLILISIVQETITIIWRRPTSRSYFLTMRKISDRPIGWQGPFIYAQTMRNLCAYVRMRTGNISGQQGMGLAGRFGWLGGSGLAWLASWVRLA
jgi:hypothetical protein